MRIMFIGANHEVTGSCSYLEVNGKKFLVDYGMQQGRHMYKHADLPVKPAELDYVFLTHAHIDHSGLLPLLYKEGFTGTIHAMEATANLCNIMLLDSAHIQESDAAYASKKNKRKAKQKVEPLYTVQDAEGVMELFQVHPYDKQIDIADGISVTFVDAGHLLGSSSLYFVFRENGEERRFVFSGDIGNYNIPLLRDPTYLDNADYVLMESTYGDKQHDAPPDYATELAQVLQETFDRGGNVVIPSFAVGRTQELLYFIRQIKEKGMVKGYPHFPVYIDSPLAISATRVFVDNARYCYDDEAVELLKKGINPIDCPDLETAISTAESVEINNDTTPKVIISASGMCEAGRIRHHLKHNLWRPECTILFVGYQAEGTLGRILCDGVEEVRLFGEEIAVKAQIKILAGISGHADNNGLIHWISAFTSQPEMVFVNHGEDEITKTFTTQLFREFGFNAFAPYSGTEFDMITGEFVNVTGPEMLEEKATAKDVLSGMKESYRKVLDAVKRLTALVSKTSGFSNWELEKLAKRINKLSDDIESDK